jgi:flagellar hook-associated protein 2
MATLSAPGIGSNLDVNGIVQQLMAVERQPLATLAKSQGAYQTQLSAYGNLRSAMSNFQGAVQAMDSVSTLQAVKTSSSDTEVLTTTTGSGAGLGSHDVEVINLAAQHKINSSAFANAASTVGTGLLTFQFGTYNSGTNSFALNGNKTAQSVAIGDAQNSLAGIRDAVNAAAIGVTASIVNDGSGSRLVFASKDSGAANSIKVTVADADGIHTDNTGLSQLAYDPTASAGSGKNLSQAVAARDASLKIDGISVSSASNTVTDAIEGVTLNLVKANPGSTVSVQVTRDSTAVQASVGSFVRAYNDFNKTLANLIAYDPSTKQRGPLQGDTVAVGMQQGLRQTLNNPIQGLTGNLTRLSQIGVSFQKDGTLSLDSSKLQTAIDKNFDGIAGLFSSVGKVSDTRTAYSTSSTNTQPGSYAVQVTQVATRGSLAGNQAAGLTITAGVNDTLVFDVDGTTTTVTLGAGTYASAAALAAEVQSRINGTTGIVSAGASVAVSESSGILSVTSASFGDSSKVTVQASAATTNLFGAAPAATTGVNVAGTINGATASGAGQVLTGAAGDPSAGLAIKITATAPASLGSVQFSRGYASQLKAWAADLLATKGALSSRTEGIGARMRTIVKQQDAITTRLDATERRYRTQFAALDAAVSSMNTTSSYLQTQLANLPSPN